MTTLSPSLSEYNQTYIDEFIQDCKLRQLTPGSIRSHVSNIRTVGKYLQTHNKNYNEIDKNILKEVLSYLLNERKISYKTLDSYFTALSSFYEYLEYEEMVPKNPIPSFRKRYLKRYKKNQGSSKRKLISIDEMSMLINTTLEFRDKTIMTVLAKTGVRRNELITMDIEDIDWEELSIKLKPKKKRSNLNVYFDNETAILLRKWTQTRDYYPNRNTPALFLGEQGHRIGRNVLYKLVTKHAERAGLHNPNSNKLEDHFTPHCFRHWFTTNLRRGNMKKDFIKELRGDARSDAMDIYDHIEKQELKKAYLAAIPRLGIF
jgi:integrase/recombinase XerD